MPMEGSEDEDAVNSGLIREALTLYIDKTRRDEVETRSWIRQPNNFISVVAIVLSLAGVVYQFAKDRVDGIDQDLASVSQIASELAQMDGQLLSATNVSQDAQLAMNNRRVVLLAEADRLINDLGNRVPTAQLAVLAPEYADIGDANTALKYLRLLTDPPASQTERLEAWRSIGVLLSYEGPGSLNDSRSAFQQAAAVFQNPTDIGSIGLEITVHEQWSAVEAQTSNYFAAATQISDARFLLDKFACIPARAPIVERVDTEGQQALQNLRRFEPSEAAAAQVDWSHAVDTDVCPKTEAQPQVSANTVSVLKTTTTTVCHFADGPRKGTTFDFRQFGIAGIPVGAPCTDGQGSDGVAVQ